MAKTRFLNRKAAAASALGHDGWQRSDGRMQCQLRTED
jgi:hypothetical protein